jgi:hypothetical protein
MAALGRLEEQVTFKSRPLWGVKAGKGLIKCAFVGEKSLERYQNARYNNNNKKNK